MKLVEGVMEIVEERTAESWREVSESLRDSDNKLQLEAAINDYVAGVIEQAFCLGWECARRPDGRFFFQE